MTFKEAYKESFHLNIPKYETNNRFSESVN